MDSYIDFDDFTKLLNKYVELIKQNKILRSSYISYSIVDIEKLKLVLTTEECNYVRRYKAKPNIMPLQFKKDELENIDKWGYYYFCLCTNDYIFNFETIGKTNLGNYFYIETRYNMSSINSYVDIYICNDFRELFENYIPETLINDIKYKVIKGDK